MLKIDSDHTTMHLTRGDRCSFKVKVINPETLEQYTFLEGSYVSFVIVPQKGYTMGAVLRKTINITEDTQEVEFLLTENDTKIGNMIDKRVKYWYNVAVNDDITVIGSDNNGEKVIYLYPEVGEEND